MSDELPTAGQRKGWMALMLLAGLIFGGALWAVAFLPCSGSPDVSACGAQATSFFYSYCCAVQRNPPWILISGVAAAPALVLTWWWRTQHKDKDVEHKEADIAAAKRQERADRFLKAAESAWSVSVPVRLGGIFSLEMLAREFPEDRQRVVETLCSIVRTQRPLSGWSDDVKAAISSACGSWATGIRLELVEANLEGWEARGKKLNGANLGASDLTNARLVQTELSKAILVSATLDGGELFEVSFVEAELGALRAEQCKFYKVNFTRARAGTAIFKKCTFSNCTFEDADLSSATLSNARIEGLCDFSGANLRRSDLSGSDLRRAKLGKADLRGAQYDEHTKFPGGFDPQQAGMVNYGAPPASEDD